MIKRLNKLIDEYPVTSTLTLVAVLLVTMVVLDIILKLCFDI